MRRALVLVLVLVSLAGPAAADEGPWGWPLPGSSPEVSRPFAPPESRYGAGHRGVDLVATPGSPVLAAGAGRVGFAGLLAGRGVVVVVHGSLRTTYEPVTASVPVGASVAVGDVLGTLEPGHLGCPAAACLHWGLRRGEQYLDPMRLVQRGPVRLLPVGADRTAARPAPPPVINAGVPHFSGAREVRQDGVDQGAARAAGAGAAAGSGAAPPELAEPSWSLRAAEAPLGMAAVAALVLGIALIARPRTDPPGPASGGAAAPATRSVVPDDLDRPDALLLDLDDARLRRDAS